MPSRPFHSFRWTNLFRSLLVATLGCAGTGPQELNCAEPGTSQGIGIAIQDGKTGAAYPFQDVMAVAIDGSFRDSVAIAAIASVADQRVLWLAHDREGSYSVTVSAQGYSSWTRSGVVVARKDCKIVPVVLTVELQPAT